MSAGRQGVEITGGTYMLCCWLFMIWFVLERGFRNLVGVLTEILEKMP